MSMIYKRFVSVRFCLFFVLSLSLGMSVQAKETQKRTPEEWSRFLRISVEKFKSYNQVLDSIEREFAPELNSRNAELEIRRHWNVRQYGLQVRRKGEKAQIHITGGVLRHPGLSRDSFALMVCHELGHHLGGFPKQPDAPWNTAEGQADYFATSKCMRKIFTQEEQTEYLNNAKISADVKKTCEQQFAKQLERAQCMRSLMTALEIAYVSLEIKDPSIKTPDTGVVSKTLLKWPAPQCRLDTFVQGALCQVSAETSFSDTDEALGACRSGEMGGRPRCWFAPQSKQGPSSL